MTLTTLQLTCLIGGAFSAGTFFGFVVAALMSANEADK